MTERAQRYDALILAGGAGRRLGGADKALLDVGGRTLLERVLAAVAEADRVVCVGPVRATNQMVTWCREEPPGGGPVAALSAGLESLSASTGAALSTGAGAGASSALSPPEVVVVLAVDLPFVDVEAVSALVQAIGDLDGAVAVDGTGRAQPLLAAYRRAALDARLRLIGRPGGARVWDLVAGLRLRDVPLTAAAEDCDTVEALHAARAQLDT